jgi:hypothetical protein
VSSSESEPLPIRPRPLAGELLSSWIVRLAYSLGQKVETLCARLFGRGHAIWSRDVDAHPPEKILRQLAQATGIDIETVRGHSLENYKEELGAPNPNAAVLPWITALGVYHRARRQHGLAYCPICLRDETPHFRKAWRLGFVAVCPEHGCELRDACAWCGEPIEPHRLDRRGTGFIPSALALRMCWNCGADLSRAPAQSADLALVNFTATALARLQVGYAQRGHNPSLYACLYFRGLRRITAAFAPAGCEIEFARVETRRAVMLGVAEAMSGDAPHLVATLRRAGVLYSQVVVSRHTTPYWLECELLALARSQASNRLHGEAVAAAQVLEGRRGAFRNSWLRSDFRVDVSRVRLPAELRSEVTWDVFDELIAAVEHDVSSAPDAVTRFRHLQDKVLFILLRFERWNAASLAQLRAPDAGVASRDAPLLDTWSLPRSEDHALSWLAWHHAVLRPQLPRLHGASHEFLSPHTGRSIGDTAIHGRFARAVDRAMLRARIPDLAAFRRH